MKQILSYWSIDTAGICTLLLTCLFYTIAVRGRFGRRMPYFISAVLVIILCTASPLHFLAEHALFSAHMLAHVLLLLVAGPLLVAALPPENRFRKPLLRLSRRIAATPLLAWVTGVAVMWIWHVPVLFDRMASMNAMGQATPGMAALMCIHMVSLLLAGALFSWPVLGPYPQYRLGALTAVAYLASACIFCSLLGLLITFAPEGLYTGYVTGGTTPSVLQIIRRDWQISPAIDQQIAGLVMWVPCCFIYLSASMVILVKWFQHKDLSTTSNLKIHNL